MGKKESDYFGVMFSTGNPGVEAIKD